ncbi:hypothetical protein [Streptomyces sp. NPDC006446]|uniref:hypothetical protein n=1 Tax=Streptomyces sp. NPDC006446 TaxID=3154301 RepID=UPI0033B7ECB8
MGWTTRSSSGRAHLAGPRLALCRPVHGGSPCADRRIPRPSSAVLAAAPRAVLPPYALRVLVPPTATALPVAGVVVGAALGLKPSLAAVVLLVVVARRRRVPAAVVLVPAVASGGAALLMPDPAGFVTRTLRPLPAGRGAAAARGAPVPRVRRPRGP